jgi:hypothetical protein
MDNRIKQEKILTALRSGWYSLPKIEIDLGIPKNTLEQAKLGARKIPTKYLDLLIKELKL